MGLFSRKPEVAPTPAPAKRRRKGVTCGELNRAVEAACASLDPTCSTVKTLKCLWSLTDGATDEDAIVLEGPPPVTMPELDAALSEIRDPELGLTASTISALAKVRALLATDGQVNTHAAEPVQYLTLAQAKVLADQLNDLLAWVVGAMGEEFALANPSRSHLLDLLGRSATGSPAREKLFRKIAAFKAADVRPRTQAELLRYQVSGKWR